MKNDELDAYASYLDGIRTEKSVYTCAALTPDEFFSTRGNAAPSFEVSSHGEFQRGVQLLLRSSEKITANTLQNERWIRSSAPCVSVTPVITTKPAAATPPPSPVVYLHEVRDPPRVFLPDQLAEMPEAHVEPKTHASLADLLHSPIALVETSRLMRLQLVGDVSPASPALDCAQASAGSLAYGIHTLAEIDRHDVDGSVHALNTTGTDAQKLCHLNAITQLLHDDLDNGVYHDLLVATNQPHDAGKIIALSQQSTLPLNARSKCVMAPSIEHRYAHTASGVRASELMRRHADPMVTHDFRPDAVKSDGIACFQRALNDEQLLDQDFDPTNALHVTEQEALNGMHSRVISTMDAHRPSLATIEHRLQPLSDAQLEGLRQLLELTTYHARNNLKHDGHGLFESVGRQQNADANAFSHKAFTEATATAFHDWQGVYSGAPLANLDAAELQSRLEKIGPARAAAMHSLMTRIAYMGRLQNAVDAVADKGDAGASPPVTLEQVTRVVRSAALKRRSTAGGILLYKDRVNAAQKAFVSDPLTYPDPKSRVHMQTVLTAAAAFGYTALTDAERDALCTTSVDLANVARNVDYFLYKTNPVQLTEEHVASICDASKARLAAGLVKLPAPVQVVPAAAKIATTAAPAAAAVVAVDHAARPTAYAVFKKDMDARHPFQLLVSLAMPEYKRKPIVGTLFLVPARSLVPLEVSARGTMDAKRRYIESRMIRTADNCNADFSVHSEFKMADGSMSGKILAKYTPAQIAAFRAAFETAAHLNSQWWILS